jgi:hypothetical protein
MLGSKAFCAKARGYNGLTSRHCFEKLNAHSATAADWGNEYSKLLKVKVMGLVLDKTSRTFKGPVFAKNLKLRIPYFGRNLIDEPPHSSDVGRPIHGAKMVGRRRGGSALLPGAIDKVNAAGC